MKRKLMILCLLAISGCAITPPSPRGELLFARESFNGVVNSLKILKDAGSFSSDDIAKIEVLINTGDKLLDKWHIAILEGTKPPAVMDAVTIIIVELLKYKGVNNGQQ